jgi:hypothetical protein
MVYIHILPYITTLHYYDHATEPFQFFERRITTK